MQKDLENLEKKNGISNNRERNNSDLPDNQHDIDSMQQEKIIIDMPGVEDIPGQEFIHPPKMESFSDTTISSSDEEGEGIFDDEEDLS
ncbi:MAG: hypothetical protein ABIW38_09340 [Ferruginibacter sp.]